MAGEEVVVDIHGAGWGRHHPDIHHAEIIQRVAVDTFTPSGSRRAASAGIDRMVTALGSKILKHQQDNHHAAEKSANLLSVIG